jgi:cytochrome b6-f complex iron-sulfur subunit
MEIVRGEFDRSKRLEPISETDEKRREVIDKAQETVVTDYDGSRRNILGIIVGGLGAALAALVVYPIIRFTWPPEKKKKEESSVVVAKESDIPVNTAKIVRFNNDTVFIVNKGGEFHAMNAVCTHLGCKVQWESKEQVVWCACHGAKYSETGEKISGPQPRSLDKYAVKVKDGNLVVSKA